MKVSQAILRQYTDVPDDLRALRDLLDDVGIEVKRVEHGDLGAVLTLELLANRGDHACYLGVSREIVGRTGGRLTPPPTPELELGSHPWPLRLQTDLCLQYSATLLRRVGPSRDLPSDALLPLLATDVHSISPPVDASNLANIEFGQPTHAFDADTISGPITIRLSRAGETAWPLFQEERIELPVGTLVIADDEKILAIAGVIGCEESKATEATERLLLESATFDPVAVRKTSRALGIQTDSSSRFERGADPAMALVGAARVVDLLEQHDGWQRTGPTGLVGDWEDPCRVIALDIPSAAGYLEYPLTAEEAAERLSRYGFRVSGSSLAWRRENDWQVPAEIREQSRDRLRNTVLVQVPPHRLWDVEFPEDLYEELAKSIGYNETPTRLPSADMGTLPSREEDIKRRVEEVLLGHGFYEVFTDGFYSRETRSRLGIDEEHPLWAHVETQNSLDRAYSLLKNNALAQAVEAVAENLRRRNVEVKAYEWTRTFHPDPEAPNGVCNEQRLLWAVVCGHAAEPTWAGSGQVADPWFLKGVVEEIALELGIELMLGAPDPEDPLSFGLHPNRQATVLLGDQRVGVLGEVHPALCRTWRIRRERPCYLEITLDALLSDRGETTYHPPSDQHPIVRNLAFTLPNRVQAGDIAEHLLTSGPPWLRRVGIVDLYSHDEDGAPVRTITYELVYENDETQRTAEEVNAASDYLITAVVKRFGDRGVKLRA